MIPYTLQSKVDALYQAFANEPYVPREHWTTNRVFELDPLYQHTMKQYEADPLFERQQHEFVLDNVFGGSRRDRTAHT